MKKIAGIAVLFAIALAALPHTASRAKSPAAQKSAEAGKAHTAGEAVAKTDDPELLARVTSENGLSAEKISSPDGDGNIFLVKSDEGRSAKKIIQILEKNSAVEAAQPNYKYKKLGRVANDRYFAQEWWFFDTADYPGGVGASSAWNAETKKQSDVTVAVIDSGANLKHTDLKKNISKGKRKGKNFEYPKRKPTDDDGHGSFLAGVIAAVSGNKKGLAGASFANNLKVTPLRFDFTTAQAIEALNWAGSKGIRVVNASWGAYGNDGNDQLLKDAIAQYPGVFVTASGNEATNHESGNGNDKMYPCDFDLPNIICVAASDRQGALTDYSDYGAASVDVSAPGGTDSDQILSISGSKQKYVHGEGSSVSTAFVSAEAGLIISKYPNLSNAQIIEAIKNSVDLEPSLAGKILSGGKVNFQKALELAATY